MKQYFSIIPNKHYGGQNYIKLNENNLPVLPLESRLHEMMVINTINDQNMLQFVYDFEPASDRSWLYSTKLIDSLLFHKGRGGLY